MTPTNKNDPHQRERSQLLLKQTEIRKLILSEGMKGDKTYTNYRISLPIEWVKEEGLEDGGFIKITKNDKGGLCIEKIVM